MKKRPSSKLILIAHDKSITSRTRKLRGILKAADESGMIDLKIMDEGRDLSPEFVDQQASLGVQAFIVGASGVSSGVSRICENRIPVVTISQQYRLWERSCAIHTDNAALSHEAAHILSAHRQTDSFAYFPALGNPQWSTERA